jgi:hypothetical protein
MSLRGEFVSELPEGVFDSTEELVIGEVPPFLGPALEDSVRIATQGREDLLATVLAIWGGRVRGGGGFIQQGNLPGVESRRALEHREQFPGLDSKELHFLRKPIVPNEES